MRRLSDVSGTSLFTAGILVALLAIGGPAAAGQENGPYSIGHTTVVITDTARNPDGSTPVSTSGRPLYLHIWYPTSRVTDQHIRYTWNNPIYNANPGGAVYPGFPDVPALSFTGSSSAHPVAEGAPLANGKFPLLVATHGFEVAAAKNMPDTLEALASHGYVVASVEHSGDDDAWFQAHALETFFGLPLGPNPSIYAAVIYQRAKDVSFVIGAVLEGTLDRQLGTTFAKQVDSDRIGVLGYSLGGETSLATVTGISVQGLPADRRIKAAFMGAGSNYGLLLNSTDYANAGIPLMFLGNDTGIAYENFNAFTHSHPKYLVDIAGFNHHTGGYQTSWCQDFHNSMLAVNPTPQSLTDLADLVFDATFYFSYTGPRELGVYNFCDPSAFDGISDAQLTAVLFGDPEILTAKKELQPSMPLAPELAIDEVARLTTSYAVSFFNSTLKHDDRYAGFLDDSADNRQANPLVHLISNCEHVKSHPLDLHANDRITFVPVGDDGYNVSVTSGTTLLDQGTTRLKVGGGASVYLTYTGFSFPVPGMPQPISALIVNEHGAITSRTSADYPGVDDNGSPWYMKGQLLLTNRFTIGALMKDLDSTAAAAGGGVFAYFDAANGRVVVTYSGVPATGTTQPNTLQIVIYSTGKIELNVGALAGTGPVYAPKILGTLGIAAGQTKARDLRKTRAIDFADLRDAAPVFVPFGRDGAIYEQYYLGTDASCSDGNGDDDGDPTK